LRGLPLWHLCFTPAWHCCSFPDIATF
jgi:hypothetical protein